MRKGNAANLLDPARRSNDAAEFENALRRKIVGQDQAVDKVAEIYQMFVAGLNPPGRPVANLLLLGPTGAGKTRLVEPRPKRCSAIPTPRSRLIVASSSFPMGLPDSSVRLRDTSDIARPILC
jgi:hypothetical protein